MDDLPEDLPEELRAKLRAAKRRVIDASNTIEAVIENVQAVKGDRHAALLRGALAVCQVSDLFGVAMSMPDEAKGLAARPLISALQTLVHELATSMYVLAALPEGEAEKLSKQATELADRAKVRI